MEEKKIGFNTIPNNTAKENFRPLESDQQEFEKKFQVQPEISKVPRNKFQLQYNIINRLAEIYKNSEYAQRKQEKADVSKQNLSSKQEKPATRYMKYILDAYYAEEKKNRPENLYENVFILEKDKNGNIINFRSNGSGNVLVIEYDGTEKLYRKPDDVDFADFFAYYAGIPNYKYNPEEKHRRTVARVLANAGFHSDGKNWYNTENKKNDATKKYDIYGNRFYQILPPKDELKKQVYDANQNLFKKWGKQITALEGNTAYLDNGKGKILANVPYLNQLKNKTKVKDINGIFTGKDMCQLTSLAMVLESKNIYSKDKKRNFADELYDIAEKENFVGNKVWHNVPVTYNAILKKSYPELKTSHINANGKEFDKQEIKKQIDNENPVIMSIGYKVYKPDEEDKSKSVEEIAGHTVTVIGYTDKGFIVHDPYGNLNKGVNEHLSNDFDGSFVEYDYDKWSIGKRWFQTVD